MRIEISTAQRLGLGCPPEDSADQPVEVQVVQRRLRVGDDQRGDEFGKRPRCRLFVFIDVQDHVRRLQSADPFEVHRLGASHFRDATDDLAGVDAEAGTADEL